MHTFIVEVDPELEPVDCRIAPLTEVVEGATRGVLTHHRINTYIIKSSYLASLTVES